MNNPFYKTYRFFKAKKLTLLGILLVLASLLTYIALKLNFEEDITKLIPQSEETKTLNKVLNNVDFSDKIIVNITSKKENPNKLATFATELLDSINKHCKNDILNIQGEITNDNMVETMDFVYNNLPLFLNDKDYTYAKQKLTTDSITQVVQNNYKTLVSPSGLIAKKIIRKDPFGLTFKALKKLESLKIADSFDIYNGFLMTSNKKNILLFIKPKLAANETDANALFVKKLYQISEELNAKYTNVIHSEYYGSTVIAVANANQIKTDIQFTVSIAMTVLLLILILFYKKLTIPIILFLPTVFGALIAVVSLYFIREKVSAISLGIGSILLGITLDYSLHILTHYRKNQNIKQLYKDITKPVLMSSITTAIAFLCLLLLKSQALQDLGIFASISVLSSSVFALFLIPLLYQPKTVNNEQSNNLIEKIASYNYDKSKYLIFAIIALFIISMFTSSKVTFNKDLSKMNYMNEASLKAEEHLESILNLSSKSVYIVAYGKNRDSILDTNFAISNLLKKAKLEQTIIQYSSIGSIVLSQKKQKEKIAKWNAFWSETTKQQVKENLIKSGKKVGFNETTYQPFYNQINKKFKPIDLKKYGKVKSLLTQEYISDKEFKTAVSIVKLNPEKKATLKKLVAKLPNTLLIDRKEINETFLGGLKENFSSLINYSLLAVVLILFLFYRNIELTLLTSIPIAVTWILTLGLMYFFNIEFTIFNVIISTFIFGLGVDYSIFLTNALVKDYTYGTQEIKTYKVSIILSVLTTILGVGVLIFAKHPALKSISALSLIGILTTLFVSFTIQPLLFRIFVKNRAKKGFQPIRLRSFLHAIVLLLFYGLGGMLLSLISLVILPIIPLSKKVKNSWLHKTVAKLVQAVLYGNPFVSKKVINTVNEDFKKPAIIIANHSSSLDTLTMGLATHKIVYLVNDWVYKSPVFGGIARALGFYPVSNGVDGSIEHLREKVQQGYSLMVFPEGKRSLTNKVGRFHKGAFFLQEQLQIDILPIYFHGNAEVMPKNDLIIHDGSLTVKIGERIAYDDIKFGKTARERNKSIRKFFKDKLLKLRDEIETPDYFKDILISNYIYKDKNILKLVKEDFKTNKKTYHSLHNIVPIKSTILHLADDFGQIDILLTAKHIDRKITTYISDTKKQTVAKNCYTNTYKKVTYCNRLKDLQIDSFKTLLISDFNDSTLIDSINLSNFEQIIMVGQQGEFKIKGFEIIREKNTVYLLNKI